MHNGKYVLAQLLDFIDKDVFLRISNKYNGNRYVKDFTCWNQLAVMVFGYLMEGEINALDNVLKNAKHPFTAIIGGSKVSYVSTGGGAMLEAIEGKELPGVAAIRG